MPVTAKDIARELNLSQPTVSRVLNGDKQHRVSDDTRQRIVEAAKRLRYQPNAVARSLRQGRTNIVGLYTNHNYDARNDFLGTIIGSLQRACEVEGLDLLLHSALLGGSAEDIYGKLRDGRIDGLILHANADDPLVTILGKSPLPVVAVADRLPNLPAVICDDGEGMGQLMGHLWERGYRRFAFLTPHESLTSVERRRSAFEAKISAWGLSPEDGLVIPIDAEQPEAALATLLSGDGRFAACCWNDRTAYNLLALCDRRGIRVPGDLAVAGFDGFLAEKVPKWQLVTICCPWEHAATAALSALKSLIAGEETPFETCLPVTLCTGDTV